MSDEKPWAHLGFAEEQAPFEGPTQKARFWTEAWVARSLFCPNCGAATISRFPANRRLADFECRGCSEEYELKAQKSRFGAKVLDGAYGAKLQRLEAANNPNLMLMNYDAARLRVTDLIVVPKHFFTAGIIEACFYEPSAMRVKADLFDIRRRLKGKGKLRGILRPSHPDIAGKGEFLEAVAALRAGGVDELAFYNWGHLRRANLAWIGDATSSVVAFVALYAMSRFRFERSISRRRQSSTRPETTFGLSVWGSLTSSGLAGGSGVLRNLLRRARPVPPGSAA